MSYDDWKLQTPPESKKPINLNSGLSEFQKAVNCPYNISHKLRITKIDFDQRIENARKLLAEIEKCNDQLREILFGNYIVECT
jgi:glutaredoxin 2